MTARMSISRFVTATPPPGYGPQRSLKWRSNHLGVIWRSRNLQRATVTPGTVYPPPLHPSRGRTAAGQRRDATRGLGARRRKDASTNGAARFLLEGAS